MTEALVSGESGSGGCLLWRKATLPALGPTRMPLGPGQVALGSVLPVGRFSPRWTQEPRLSPAGESASCRSLSAFQLFMKLMQAPIGFDVYLWAQVPFSLLPVTL